ncbi:response regulator [Rurimicrobium arvi]|uniref:Response regulator n=1 Tax=Rurimicrobium arvi TaxID=2049916 RepID=A0ABP8MXR3_9BACT
MEPFQLACIIDDDPIFVFAAGKQMELRSFATGTLVYRNGKEAIEGLKQRIQLEQAFPEVILLDLNMPVMDGWQFLEALTEITLPVTPKLYVVSSSINPADIERARSFSLVTDFVTKPIAPELLEEIADGRR